MKSNKIHKSAIKIFNNGSFQAHPDPGYSVYSDLGRAPTSRMKYDIQNKSSTNGTSCVCIVVLVLASSA